MLKRVLAMREKALGPEHPDVAISLANLALALTPRGRPVEALAAVDRALEIHKKHGDPDPFGMANLHGNRGDALVALGRHDEAEGEFTSVLQIVGDDPTHDNENRSQALHGLGNVRLAQGQTAVGIQLLERALSIRERDEVDDALTADTRFTLARALWESGKGRRRARSLAATAKDGYGRSNRADSEQTVAAWLTTHRMAQQ